MKNNPIRAAMAKGTRLFMARFFGMIVVPVLLVVFWQISGRFERQFGVTNSMADSIYAMSIVCDREGHIVYLNNKVEEYTGFTKAEITAGGVTLLVPPELESTHAVQFAKAAKSPKIDAAPHLFHGHFCTSTPGERISAVFSISWIEVDGLPYAHSIILPDGVLRSLLEVQ